MSPDMLQALLKAFLETLYMVFVSTALATAGGVPLGVILFTTRKGHVLAQPTVNCLLAMFTNALRSIPFIILMVAITPFTRLVVGTSIGTVAAMVPLAVAAIPFFARIVESAMKEVPAGLIEASQAMGSQDPRP